MRIFFIGAVKFSGESLKKIIAMGGTVVGVCTLKNSGIHSDFFDLTDIAIENKIPVRYVDDINSSENVDWISKMKPDVIFCFGWSRLLKKEILDLTPLGVIGFHPAALPKNRGRHPIIWSLVLGLKSTASTFFFMDEGIDSGDILSQTAITIENSDDAGSLYKKIINTALSQLEKFIPDLQSGMFARTKQDHGLSNVWRLRGKADGAIDWRMSAEGINNLVRGLAKPYVGAHFQHDKVEYKVWKVEVVDCVLDNIEPGKILALSEGRFPIVKCGGNAIKLLEVEPEFEAKPGKYL